MADYLTNDATFPGVTGVLRCAYSCGHGTAPGRAVLTIPLTNLSDIAEVGDLTLTDGRQSVTLRDCKVVEPSYSADGGGQTETLALHDRRWRWPLAGVLFLRANVPAAAYRPVAPVSAPLDPVGNAPLPPPPVPKGEEAIRPETRKTARELAVICLEALGEKKYDVSALDPNATPSVDWDATPVTQALNQVVEPLGCRVVYRPVQDDVLIAKIGEGDELPDGPFLEDSPGLDVKARPAKIICYGAVARIQMRLALEPVGLEFDGTYQPLGRLSYRPATDWTLSFPPLFAELRDAPALPGGRIRADALALARRSVYRAYRVRMTGVDGEGDLKVPPDDKFKLGKITDRNLIRILPVKNLTAKDDIDKAYQAPAACYGRHSPPEAFRLGNDITFLYQHTTAETEVRVSFSIDQENGIILFDQPVYSWKLPGRADPPELVLEAAVNVADPKTFQWLRYRRELLVPGGLDTRIAVVVADDVRFESVAEYGKGNEFKKSTDNEAEIRGRADWHLLGESLKYVVGETGQRTYAGIVPIDPDGAIQQVSWQIGTDGPKTTASRNTEHDPYLPSYQERRQQEENDLTRIRRMQDAIIEIDREFGGPLAGLSPVR